jgi:hypothetical protein
MRGQTTVTGLSMAQWDRLQVRARTSYDIQPGTATLCAVFELDDPSTAAIEERHVEMPIQEFATLMTELAALDRVAQLAEAALTPDALPDHLEKARNDADPARATEHEEGSTGPSYGTGPGEGR